LHWVRPFAIKTNEEAATMAASSIFWLYLCPEKESGYIKRWASRFLL
jgi:hypothetical protein